MLGYETEAIDRLGTEPRTQALEQRRRFAADRTAMLTRAPQRTTAGPRPFALGCERYEFTRTQLNAAHRPGQRQPRQMLGEQRREARRLELRCRQTQFDARRHQRRTMSQPAAQRRDRALPAAQELLEVREQRLAIAQHHFMVRQFIGRVAARAEPLTRHEGAARLALTTDETIERGE